MRTIGIKVGLADKHLEPTEGWRGGERGDRSLQGVRRAIGEANSALWGGDSEGR